MSQLFSHPYASQPTPSPHLHTSPHPASPYKSHLESRQAKVRYNQYGFPIPVPSSSSGPPSPNIETDNGRCPLASSTTARRNAKGERRRATDGYHTETKGEGERRGGMEKKMLGRGEDLGSRGEGSRSTRLRMESFRPHPHPRLHPHPHPHDQLKPSSASPLPHPYPANQYRSTSSSQYSKLSETSRPVSSAESGFAPRDRVGGESEGRKQAGYAALGKNRFEEEQGHVGKRMRYPPSLTVRTSYYPHAPTARPEPSTKETYPHPEPVDYHDEVPDRHHGHQPEYDGHQYQYQYQHQHQHPSSRPETPIEAPAPLPKAHVRTQTSSPNPSTYLHLPSHPPKEIYPTPVDSHAATTSSYPTEPVKREREESIAGPRGSMMSRRGDVGEDVFQRFEALKRKVEPPVQHQEGRKRGRSEKGRSFTVPVTDIHASAQHYKASVERSKEVGEGEKKAGKSGKVGGIRVGFEGAEAVQAPVVEIRPARIMHNVPLDASATTPTTTRHPHSSSRTPTTPHTSKHHPPQQPRENLPHPPRSARSVTAPQPVEQVASREEVTEVEENERVEADDMEGEITCPICMSIMAAAHAISVCGHTMCGGCGYEWLREHDKCPICRAAITASPASTAMTPLLPMDRLIEVYVRAKGRQWDGLENWKDRKEAWEAQKLIIREEEAANPPVATSPRRGETRPEAMATSVIFGPSFDGVDGEDEYRIRDDGFPGLATFGGSLFSSFFNDLPPPFHHHAPTSPHRPNSEHWMRNFAARDFEDLDFPEPGVNPFMDAFGYSRPSPHRPAPRRFSSLPPRAPSLHRGPRGWLSDAINLVDTFARHRSPSAGHSHGHVPGPFMMHNHPEHNGWHDARSGRGRENGRELDGLEEGMARLFADLRQGRGF